MSKASEAYSFEFQFSTIPSTKLGVACFENDQKTILRYITTGIDWEKESTRPLYGALYAGRDDTALLLLEHGSPVDSYVFYLAYRFGSPRTFQKLQEETYAQYLMKDASSQSNSGSVLIDAARSQDIQTVLFVLTQGADIETTDYFYGYEGWTSLHHASRSAHFECMKLLIDRGADIQAKTESGKTPLTLCATHTRTISRKKRKACVQLLLKQGAVINPSLGWFDTILLKNGVSVFRS